LAAISATKQGRLLVDKDTYISTTTYLHTLAKELNHFHAKLFCSVGCRLR
jgi:hypothetical protein